MPARGLEAESLALSKGTKWLQKAALARMWLLVSGVVSWKVPLCVVVVLSSWFEV